MSVLLWALAIPIFLFILFPLASCTSSSLSEIYLTQFNWNEIDNIWLKVGYYGICWTGKNGTCVRTTGQSASHIVDHVFHNATARQNDIDGVQFALNLESNVFVAFMTAGGLDWFISLILVSIVMLTDGRAGAVLRTAAKMTAASAAMLMVASAWATSQSVAALEALSSYTDGNAVKGGTLLLALQWVAAILASLYSWGVFHVTNKDADKVGGNYSYKIGRRGGDV